MPVAHPKGSSFSRFGTGAIFAVGIGAILWWSKQRIQESLEGVDIIEREPGVPQLPMTHAMPPAPVAPAPIADNQRGQYGRRIRW